MKRALAHYFVVGTLGMAFVGSLVAGVVLREENRAELVAVTQEGNEFVIASRRGRDCRHMQLDAEHVPVGWVRIACRVLPRG